jgi:hypothetical protein
MDRLRRLFADMPRLEEFKIHDIVDMHNAGFTNIDTFELKIEPLVLPALSSLALYLNDAPIQFAHAISQILDIPTRALEILLIADSSETELTAEEVAAQPMMIHNLFDYAQRFWARATRCSQLPSATLSDHGVDGHRSYQYGIEIQSEDPEDAAGVSMCFSVASELHPPSDVFLPLVTHFEVIASHYSDEGPLFLSTDDWPPPGSLPALETLSVKLENDVWRTVSKIQEWVDMHVQQPIVVKFTGLYNDKEVPGLQWRTDSSPLEEVYWSAYVAGGIPRRLLPASDSYHREDVAWDSDEEDSD